MKKILFFVITLLLIYSCKKDSPTTPAVIAPVIKTTEPVAAFSTTSNEDGIVTLTNTSKDAETYEWDFGDGKGKSIEKNPIYQYNRTGKFTIKLKAIGKGGNNTVESNTDIKVVQVDIIDIDSRIEAFLKKYNIPGATLAISKNGKMVYAKGYGFADVEKQEKVTVNSRFRIGSQSKTFCAVAIMKLIQDGKLKLDDKVFGDGAILGTAYGKNVYTSDLKTITVKNLLNHTAGAWGTSDNQGDIMGRVINASNADFFGDVIDNLPLITKPGTRMSYANFGYFVLARIVEKVSGKAYLDYLNQEVLVNVGQKNKMELTGRTLAERKTDEVKYYGQTAAESSFIYDNLNIIRRDGSGGLIATAADHLRFINAIDGFDTYPDLLNAASIATLTAPAGIQGNPNYACGMIINQGYWSHAGSISCQFGDWYRSPYQLNIVLNLNSRADPNNASANSAFAADFNNLLAYPIITNTIKFQNLSLF